MLGFALINDAHLMYEPFHFGVALTTCKHITALDSEARTMALICDLHRSLEQHYELL